MAIHPTIRAARAEPSSLTPQQAQAISAWTEQAASSLQSLDITDSGVEAVPAETSRARHATVSLTIPLDDPMPTKNDIYTSRVRVVTEHRENEAPRASSETYRRREPIRRDSLKRREALLKGKEGSRRRQRWENDRLLHNPWAQPPSASDWLVQPTHTRHDPVPYYLAPLWDAHFAHKERTKPSRTGRNTKDCEDEKVKIPREIRKKLKHARAAQGMLHDLEQDIRRFVQKWNEKQLILKEEGLEDAPTSPDSGDSEDEIVFVGRNGLMHDAPAHKLRMQQMQQDISPRQEKDGEKMVFESLAHDRGAVFGRWLVHSIATYYGLYTWSVTVGDPARREAYVGFHPPALTGQEGQILFPAGQMTHCRGAAKVRPDEPLPKPLWVQL